MKKQKHVIPYLLHLGISALAWTLVLALITAAVAEDDNPPQLKEAVMCENIKDGLPVDKTIIFEVSKAAAYCWCEFDPVPADGVIYHEWYRKGTLITRKKLAVHSPRWATYSRLPLREADIGPWKLDVVDEYGNVLKTLRFSITE